MSWDGVQGRAMSEGGRADTRICFFSFSTLPPTPNAFPSWCWGYQFRVNYTLQQFCEIRMFSTIPFFLPYPSVKMRVETHHKGWRRALLGEGEGRVWYLFPVPQQSLRPSYIQSMQCQERERTEDRQQYMCLCGLVKDIMEIEFLHPSSFWPLALPSPRGMDTKWKWNKQGGKCNIQDVGHWFTKRGGGEKNRFFPPHFSSFATLLLKERNKVRKA